MSPIRRRAGSGSSSKARRRSPHRPMRRVSRSGPRSSGCCPTRPSPVSSPSTRRSPGAPTNWCAQSPTWTRPIRCRRRPGSGRAPSAPRGGSSCTSSPRRPSTPGTPTSCGSPSTARRRWAEARRRSARNGEPPVEKTVDLGFYLADSLLVVGVGAPVEDVARAAEGDVRDRDLEVDLVNAGDAGAHDDLPYDPSVRPTLGRRYDGMGTRKSLVDVGPSQLVWGPRNVLGDRRPHLLEGGQTVPADKGIAVRQCRGHTPDKWRVTGSGLARVDPHDAVREPAQPGHRLAHLL